MVKYIYIWIKFLIISMVIDNEQILKTIIASVIKLGWWGIIFNIYSFYLAYYSGSVLVLAHSNSWLKKTVLYVS